MHKTLDQRASQELRERLAREEAEAWAATLRSAAGRQATEAWARAHPEITARSAPRFIIGMAYGSFVKRYIRNLAAERESP
jgi:hypothetical protein